MRVIVIQDYCEVIDANVMDCWGKLKHEDNWVEESKARQEITLTEEHLRKDPVIIWIDSCREGILNSRISIHLLVFWSLLEEWWTLVYDVYVLCNLRKDINRDFDSLVNERISVGNIVEQV